MKNVKLIILALIIVSFASCKKKIETMQYTGTIIGYVTIWDKTDINALDFDGVTVSIGDSISVVTDNAGKFILDSIPFGTYDIKYEKKGFTSFTKYGYQFVGDSETPAYLGTIHMIEMPTHYVTNLSIDEISLNYPPYTRISISGNIVNNGEYCKIKVYYDDNENVSQTKYSGYFYLSYLDDNFNVTQDIDISKLNGTKIYMVAYGYYSGSYTFQYDPETGQSLNPTFTKMSNVASFTIPSE